MATTPMATLFPPPSLSLPLEGGWETLRDRHR